MYKTYVHAGNVLSFIYHGGQSPGTRRTVVASEVSCDNNNVKAFCITRQEFREFCRDKMEGVKCLNAEYFDTDDLPKAAKDEVVDAITEAWISEGKDIAVMDEYIVAWKNDEPSSKVIDGNRVVFYNDNKTVEIGVNQFNHLPYIRHDHELQKFNPTVAETIAALEALL